MENKYYTPSVEDIRIGYEAETLNNKNEWVKQVYNGGIDAYGFVNDWYARTPYLTKEQILAEGWNLVKKRSDNNYVYAEKGMQNLRYDVAHQMLAVWNKYDIRNEVITVPSFYGSCPSINEFKYISKLIKV